MISHYELNRDGHYYPSTVDEPEHLDPGDVDAAGRCAHQADAKTCAHGCWKTDHQKYCRDICYGCLDTVSKKEMGSLMSTFNELADRAYQAGITTFGDALSRLNVDAEDVFD